MFEWLSVQDCIVFGGMVILIPQFIMIVIKIYQLWKEGKL